MKYVYVLRTATQFGVFIYMINKMFTSSVAWATHETDASQKSVFLLCACPCSVGPMVKTKFVDVVLIKKNMARVIVKAEYQNVKDVVDLRRMFYEQNTQILAHSSSEEETNEILDDERMSLLNYMK